jgi:hypothetical protein
MSHQEPTKEVIETHGDGTKDAPYAVADSKEAQHHTFGQRVRNSISVQSIDDNTVEGQIFSMNDIDPALDKKMRLVNDVGLPQMQPDHTLFCGVSPTISDSPCAIGD